MEHFEHPCGRSRILVGPAAGALARVLPAECRTVVVTDAGVVRAHPELTAPYATILVGRGERCKTFAAVERVCRELLAADADRATFVLGVGGGIVTDIAGFAASVYMRGVRFGFVSTTLLGQVDAAVGGKNGVNVDGYKNIMGLFRQPEFVVCDPTLTGTLPDREFRAGMAEAVKAGVRAAGGTPVESPAAGRGCGTHSRGSNGPPTGRCAATRSCSPAWWRAPWG